MNVIALSAIFSFSGHGRYFINYSTECMCICVADSVKGLGTFKYILICDWVKFIHE